MVFPDSVDYETNHHKVARTTSERAGAMAGEPKGMLICFMCFFGLLGFIGFCMCATLR